MGRDLSEFRPKPKRFILLIPKVASAITAIQDLGQRMPFGRNEGSFLATLKKGSDAPEFAFERKT
ncbi:MAG TPA: hypothetical protein VFR05_03775 [Terriglobia bacterium]|nr:hypothetical protein [Terriglobia bacterium]